MPLPTLSRLPAPVSDPAKELEVLVPPMVTATAPLESLASGKGSLPERPPSERLVSEPSESVPAEPLWVSKVLFCRARMLPTWRVPAETRVVPEKVLAAESTSVPSPSFVRPPLPSTTVSSVSVVPADCSSVLAASPSVRPRLPRPLIVAVVLSVPALTAMWAAAKAPGSVPRLPTEAIESVPVWIVVEPV